MNIGIILRALVAGMDAIAYRTDTQMPSEYINVANAILQAELMKDGTLQLHEDFDEPDPVSV